MLPAVALAVLPSGSAWVTPGGTGLDAALRRPWSGWPRSGRPSPGLRARAGWADLTNSWADHGGDSAAAPIRRSSRTVVGSCRGASELPGHVVLVHFLSVGVLPSTRRSSSPNQCSEQSVGRRPVPPGRSARARGCAVQSSGASPVSRRRPARPVGGAAGLHRRPSLLVGRVSRAPVRSLVAAGGALVSPAATAETDGRAAVPHGWRTRSLGGGRESPRRCVVSPRGAVRSLGRGPLPMGRRVRSRGAGAITGRCIRAHLFPCRIPTTPCAVRA